MTAQERVYLRLREIITDILQISVNIITVKEAGALGCACTMLGCLRSVCFDKRGCRYVAYRRNYYAECGEPGFLRRKI